MLPQEIIRHKRDAAVLSAAEIEDFIAGVVSGAVTEGQMAAFCMATFFNGMQMAERIALTMAMARSGRMLKWNVPGPVLDKHSTGGVGDKVSLVLAPVIAACGGFVPMLSGRGLGHTGGTLDKMESIPGYTCQPSPELLTQVVSEVGCAIIGQTADLAPADKRLYAVRDVTATVESIDLITASILSKKLAAGLDALVMDVKFGTGAFMPELPKAEELAKSIATVATGAGVRTHALLTDMNQLLGTTAGNALEVAECIAWLKGEQPDVRLEEVTLALCAEMLMLGSVADSLSAARQKCKDALASGKAAEKFAQMVAALGGPKDILEQPDKYLAPAPVIHKAVAPQSGYVSAMDVRQIGLLVVELGGGRTRPQDPVDPAVGLSHVVQLGQQLKAGDTLAVVHARSAAQAAHTAQKLAEFIKLSDAPPELLPIVNKTLTA